MVRTRRSGLATLGAILLLTAGLLAGCARPVPGSATSAAVVDVSIPGSSVVQAPDVVSNSAAAQVGGILADLQDFWRAELGKQMTPLAGGYALIDSADRSSTTAGLCAAAMSLSGNAFYCPDQDGIVIDAAALVPVVADHYGIGGLAAALAHEFGHAVQARVGPTQKQQSAAPQRYPQVLIEAQADCAAGAFLSWAVAGHSERLHLPAGLLLSAVSPLVDFRDPVTAAATDSAAHGLGMDRLRFVLGGMDHGGRSCFAMTTSDLALTLGKAGTSQQSAARFADPQTVAAAAVISVHNWDHREQDGNQGPGDPVLAADLSAAQPLGQFAQATATALALGRSRFPDDAGEACFAGAWTAAVFGHSTPGGLGSWPGDADEAMDLIRTRPRTSFADLVAFVDGFDNGLSACH